MSKATYYSVLTTQYSPLLTTTACNLLPLTALPPLNQQGRGRPNPNINPDPNPNPNPDANANANGKVEDDSLVHTARLVAELQLMTQVSSQ